MFASAVPPSIDALAVNPAEHRASRAASLEATLEPTQRAPSLVLGIGCRRGVTLAQVDAAVRAALGAWPIESVTCVATLDAKADEPALQAFCAARALPLHTYTREQLAATPTTAPPSAAAQAQFGVDGVCEPCARLAAAGGPLVHGKLVLDGVTVAIARTLENPANADAKNPQQPHSRR
ncbi:cobalamin biosynthesis protein [Paraburkholderia flagellata]|uniref:cobalamin biosynthesis protein n=1 Tax=Paraburkholderia flagellata TaxID=2883241 RepID=UPI001F379647|nr:cobalamin biosynthesis protein [Paraburkholderia flagellata]